MPIQVIFFILVNGLIMLSINPFGAVIYAVACLAYAPTGLSDLPVLTMASYTIMLLTQLIIKGRTNN